MAIGIEVPRGAVVELLVERGFAVYAINPKQMDRFRDRFTPAGAKDDRRDALVIGDSLRTDPQAFRQVRLDHPADHSSCANGRASMRSSAPSSRGSPIRCVTWSIAAHPGLLALSPAADDPWLWALLRARPHARDATTPVANAVSTDCCGVTASVGVTATQVRAVLQQPHVFTAPGVIDAVAAHLTVAAAARRTDRGASAGRQNGTLDRLLEML